MNTPTGAAANTRRLNHHPLLCARNGPILACGLLLIALAGCQSARLGAGPQFPATLAQAQDLDIHVTRDDTRITLTNTSARAFGPSVLWVNKQYGRPIDGFAVGQSLQLPLTSFRNEYGEPFRAGGFFATEKPQVVTHVQIEHEGELIGLRAVNVP